jgi:hypothetical protein
MIIAVAWNLYYGSAPPRILPKFFGIAADSLEAQIIMVVLVVIVLGVAFAFARSQRSKRAS